MGSLHTLKKTDVSVVTANKVRKVEKMITEWLVRKSGYQTSNTIFLLKVKGCSYYINIAVCFEIKNRINVWYGLRFTEVDSYEKYS